MSYAMEQEPRPHLITCEEFFRMGELGLLASDARVELIEGVIIDMSPPGASHCRAVDLLNEQLVEAAKGKAIVRPGGSVWLSRWTTVLPDFALLRVRKDRYGAVHPTGPELLLAIEISASSLRYDLDTKMKLYARHGVQECWVIDLNNSRLLVCRGRTDLGYADVRETSTPGVMRLPSLDASVDLSELFAKN